MNIYFRLPKNFSPFKNFEYPKLKSWARQPIKLSRAAPAPLFP